MKVTGVVKEEEYFFGVKITLGLRKLIFEERKNHKRYLIALK